MNNNQQSYKYVKVQKKIDSKIKGKNTIISILLCLPVVFMLFIVLSVLALFLIFIIFGHNIFDEQLLTDVIIMLLIAILFLSLYMKYSRKNHDEEYDTIRVDGNFKNKCINCGKEFDLDLYACPYCKCSGFSLVECPNCSVLNNVNREKCINCGKELTVEYRKENTSIFYEDKEETPVSDGKIKCINCGKEFDNDNCICPYCNFYTDIECICSKCNTSNNVMRSKCVSCGNELTYASKVLAADKKIRPVEIVMLIILIVIVYIISLLTNRGFHIDAIYYVIGVVFVVLLSLLDYFVFYKKYKDNSNIKNKIIICERKIKKL